MRTDLNIRVEVEIEILQIRVLSPKEEEELQTVTSYKRKVLIYQLVQIDNLL